MLKYSTKSEYILAIATSTRRIEAVLVHDAPTGPIILRTFTRKRNGNEAFELDAPSVELEKASDVSFSATDSAGVDSSMFLASEFGDLPTAPSMETELMPPSQAAVPCDLEIQDVVAECADAGYENVRIVFVLPTDYVGSEILGADNDAEEDRKDGKKTKAAKKPAKSAKRDHLIKQLRKEVPMVEDHKVTFLPLNGYQGSATTQLAVFAQSNEPVSVSLSSIRNRNRPFPNVALLENEVTLLLGAARAALIAEQRYHLVAAVVNEIQETADASEKSSTGPAMGEEETSVVIRVGGEDTVVMFLVGQELVHYESLRSITAWDPAETICSRILLMHDEFGAGDSDRILLFCDANENSIRDRLTQIFPDSHLTLLRDLVPPFEEVRKKPIETETFLAALGALRLVSDEVWESVFPESNFLDPKLRGRKFTLPFSWPVAAMILILFGTTLFFVYRYFEQSHGIEMVRYELRNYPEDMIASNADDLQEKIDSLKARSSGFAEALDVLDSLLVGSDVWSRALERTSVHTRDVTGLWIETWREEDKGRLVVTGKALDRNKIVQFATGAEANIESITFAEIRDVPVYEFRMTMRIQRELPEAAKYLRENAKQIMASGADEADATTADASASMDASAPTADPSKSATPSQSTEAGR